MCRVVAPIRQHFTIFSYQRTIFDRLPMRSPISVIRRQSVTSFDITSVTSTALAVGRQPSTFYANGATPNEEIRRLSTAFCRFWDSWILTTGRTLAYLVEYGVFKEHSVVPWCFLSNPVVVCQITPVFVELRRIWGNSPDPRNPSLIVLIYYSIDLYLSFLRCLYFHYTPDRIVCQPLF